jgi:propionyl-CoA carboxylase alpha chain
VAAAFRVPAGYGVRLDSGVEDGSVVGVHYDPMLAKVIAWGATRADAARRLAAALAGSEVHGVVTNRDLLVRVLRHPAFLAGETDTGFFDRHGLDTLAAPLASPETVRLSVLAAALAGAARRRTEARALRGLPSGWRNNPSQPQRIGYRTPDGETHDVEYAFDRYPGAAPDAVTLESEGVRRRFAVHAVGEVSYVDSVGGSVTLTEVPRFPDPSAQVEAGSLLAPMPGTVVRLHVAEGHRVAAGQPLLVLEAMKMEHPVVAPHDGAVAALRVAEGNQVEGGAVLAVITPLDEGALHGAVPQ